MRRVALGSSERIILWLAVTVGSAQQPALSTPGGARPASRAQGRLQGRRCGVAEHGVGVEPRQARGVLRSGHPAGVPSMPEGAAASGADPWPRPRCRSRRLPTVSPSRTRISPAFRARICSWGTFTASTPTTSRTRTGRGCSRRSSVPAARAMCRSTAISCSCRSSRRAAASTAGRQGSSRQRAPNGFADPHLRHQRPGAAETGGGRPDLPWLAHPQPCHRSP